MPEEPMPDAPAGTPPVITPQPDGPLLVRGLATLRNSHGAPLPVKPTLALCRCGVAKSKPFCDGSHVAGGFRSARETGGQPDRLDHYAGARLTIHDNRGLCSHAGVCTERLPSVWRMKQEPWIDPDGAGVAQIVDTIERCPSGALSYTLTPTETPAGAPPPAAPRAPEIQLAKNGPYEVRGGCALEDTPQLEGGSPEHYALCRCGGSKNKPFCDGQHWYNNFRDDEGASDDKSTGAAGGVAGDGATPDAAGDGATPDAARAEPVWRKVAEPGALPADGVLAVTAGTARMALTRVGDRYAALAGACPHQGGPLGEGTLTDGCLRCPWHGWSFDPLTGASDRGADLETFPVELRDDGLYVGVPPVLRVRTVSDLLAETLVAWGVTHVFGMVGHSNLGLAEAIRKLEVAGKLTFIGVRHEGAAAFACSGFAKLSGRPAACLTIAGPGATNLLTGLWDAHVDRAPVLALTGQVQTQVLGPGAFQEIDQVSAFAAVAAFSQTVLPGSRHAELMALALKHAIVERGVGHLIVPDEVQTLEVPESATPHGPEGRLADPAVLPSAPVLDRATGLLAAARRPIVIAGYGAREAMPAVIALAERLRAPVLTTFKAKGQIPDRHAHAAGVLGRSGTPVAAAALDEADLLCVFGASFAAHTGIDPEKPTIQVDLDRLALGKFHPVTVPVWGEIGVSARALAERLPETLAAEDQRPRLAERWDDWRQEKARRASRTRGRGLASAAIFASLTRVAPPDAVIAVDVGNNTYSFGRYFECERQSVLMSGYLGSIGFGLPAAMGAWAAAPGRPIIAVAGDGGFGQYLAELTTAVKYGMNVTLLLVNNGELGKISLEQRAGDWPVWQTELVNPDFAQYARLVGAHGVRVTEAAALDAALREAFAAEGPAVVEVIADPELI